MKNLWKSFWLLSVSMICCEDNQMISITNVFNCRNQEIEIPEETQSLSITINNCLSLNTLKIKIPHELQKIDIQSCNIVGFNKIIIESLFEQVIREKRPINIGYSSTALQQPEYHPFIAICRNHRSMLNDMLQILGALALLYVIAASILKRAC